MSRIISLRTLATLNRLQSASLPSGARHGLCRPSRTGMQHCLPVMPNNTMVIMNQGLFAAPHRGLAACASSGGGDHGTTAAPFKLVIYSKEDCPLCDKLKEKLGSIMERSAYIPSVLSGVELEVRDITTNAQWEAAYEMEIPVLAVASLDGSSGEWIIPRPSPRLTADGLEKHLEKALRPKS